MIRIAICLNLFIALTTLQACDNLENSETESNINADVYKGYYIYGHEVNTFQPCGQMKVFWISGSNDLLEKIQQQYALYTDRPYEEVFVELTGDFAGKASDGFAMDYDGQFMVTKIRMMKKRSEDDCI